MHPNVGKEMVVCNCVFMLYLRLFVTISQLIGVILRCTWMLRLDAFFNMYMYMVVVDLRCHELPLWLDATTPFFKVLNFVRITLFMFFI